MRHILLRLPYSYPSLSISEVPKHSTHTNALSLIIRSITNRWGYNTHTKKGFLVKMQGKVMVSAEVSQEVKIVQNPPDPDSKFLNSQRFTLPSSLFWRWWRARSCRRGRSPHPAPPGTSPSARRINVDLFLQSETLKDKHLEHVELQPEHCIETKDGSKAKVESKGRQGEWQVRDVGSQPVKEIISAKRIEIILRKRTGEKLTWPRGQA